MFTTPCRTIDYNKIFNIEMKPMKLNIGANIEQLQTFALCL